MAIHSVIHTNQQSIDRVLQAGLPVALVFWGKGQAVDAQWETVLTNAAETEAGRILIAKVNVDEEEPLRQRFQIQAVPAISVVKQGQVEATLPPNTTPAQLAEWLRYMARGGARPDVPQARTAHTTTQRTPSQSSSQGSAHPITLTDTNFDQIIQGEQPVLVDFWAPWCGPCRMVAPAVEETARKFQGRAVIGKLNVDENQRIAQRYQIMGIPALYIFQRGQVVDQMVGVQSAQTLQQHLARYTK
ncbi:MAG: thioredoxin [Caldilineaceae bacterium]|nr:thioredoxin [Caldilineaceae bacterium]